MKNLFCFIMVILAMPMYGKTFSLQSPNKRLQVEVVSDGTLTWNIRHDGREVMRPSQKDINNAYQTTYSQNFSWAKMSNYVIYTK